MSSVKRPPIMFTIRQVVDAETGERLGALVPASTWDRKLMRDRKYTIGTEVRAELKKPRNAAFNRLVHALGAMLSRDLDAFDGMDAHDAIKRCQRESGLCCEQSQVEIPGLGSLTLNVAKSLAFDAMDEGEFSQLWVGLCRHVSEKYWPDLTPEQVSQQAQIMEGTGP